MVIGALGAVTPQLGEWLHQIPGKTSKIIFQGVRLIGDFKFPPDLNASGNGCLFICVSPATNWWPVQDVPCFLLYGSWDTLQHHMTPN